MNSNRCQTQRGKSKIQLVFRILRALYNLSERKEEKEKGNFTLPRGYESCLACQHFILQLLIPIIIHYILTRPILFENGDFFSSLALTAYTYPVNTANENVSFQNRSQEWRFLETPFCCARLPAAVREISPRSRKRSFLKTITSRSQIPRNAHAPVKDGTVF